MASRLIPRANILNKYITVSNTRIASTSSARLFSTSRSRLQEAVVAPVKKPVGAFRGGLFGFLLGVTLAGASAYYYVIDEYKLANDMLTEDIYALQASVQRLHDHVTDLENKNAQQSR